MRTLALLLAAAALGACTTVPPMVAPPPVQAEPGYNPADIRTLTEQEVQQVLGAAAWDELRGAPTTILVRRGVSLPRMIQQPDGSWKPEGPYANAAVRTPAGWVGWPGGRRSLLAPETSREIDRLLASPELWAEPIYPYSGCTDAAGLSSVVRYRGRERASTQPCGAVGLSGRLADIVMAGRVNDWSGMPPGAVVPAGIPLGRFVEPIPTYYQYSSALNDPLNLVIDTPAEWAAMWARLTANHSPAPVPAVDFSREMLLMAAMGAMPTGGYTIRIDRVLEQPAELEAYVVRIAPGPRCGTIAAITHPVDIVRIPAGAKPVRWVVSDVVTDCP